MRNEQFVENQATTGNVIWINNVEFRTQEETLPLIGPSQLSTIFSNLDTPNKLQTCLTTHLSVAEANDLTVHNAPYKLPLIDTENNFIILKDDSIVTEVATQSPEKKKVKTKMKNNIEDNFEDMLYFVCNLCPFLCTKDTKITEHLAAAHKNKTKRKLKYLKCPACKNVFYHKVSLRSHLVHDHDVGSSDLNRIIQAVAFYSNKDDKPEDKKPIQIEATLEEETDGDKNIVVEEHMIEKHGDDDDNNGDNSIGTSEFIENNIVNIDNNYVEDATDDVLLTSHKIEQRTVTLPQLDITADSAERIFSTMIHENSVTKFLEEKSVHRCVMPRCKIRMQDINNLNYHVKCHINTSFKCLECNELFAFWKPLTSHLWRIHKVDMELYSCDKCDYKTNSLGKLNSIHKLIHSEVRAFSCSVCTKAFKNTKQLRNHMTRHRKSEKVVRTCDICCKQFSEKRQLTTHMDVVHKKIKPFLCSYCGYKGSSRSSLQMHIRQHTGEKPFSCDVCPYTTSDHNSIRRHKLRHSGQRPYKCAYCPYACIQSSTYKVHLKTKHPGMENNIMFTCEQCPFRSVNKATFTGHIMTAHKPKPA